MLAARGRGPCQHKPHARPRGYSFAGAVICGVCQRRMQGQWVNQAPYYRCRFPAEYALANKISHPRNVYLREDAFETEVTGWLAGIFAPSRLPETIDQMVSAQQDRGGDAAAEAIRARIADASIKMDRYKAAIGAGADPTEVTPGSARPARSASEPKRNYASSAPGPGPHDRRSKP
ncbi:MAG: zinc ribbon domain-containing protein [Actinomycetota bacterium]